MRTIVLATILLALVPIALFKPWIGVLTWTWIGTMNPHRLTWGFLVNFPVAAVIGGATLIGLVLTRDRRMPPMNGVTLTLLAFIAWICVTSMFALHPEMIGEMFSKVMKIQFMIFVTMALLFTQLHLKAFVWVIGLSLAFYGVKGGIYTILGGGTGRVLGPPGSFIDGNNEIALAMVMTVPLLFYLRSEVSRPWIRYGFIAAIVLTAVAILGTQSRGALLAIVAMALYLWRHSDRKFGFGLALAVAAVVLVSLMPIAWEMRMRSIGNYEADRSAMGRINAWWMAFNLASNRFLGGGFEVITPDLFARYAPSPLDLHAAHSIYFQVLGEHGFVGLFLFLLLWFLVWRMAGSVIKDARRLGMDSLRRMGSMVQVSLAGYLVGGAFLSLAYYDLPYNILVVAVLARQLLDERLRAAALDRSPAARIGTAPRTQTR